MTKTIYIAGRPEATRDNKERRDNIIKEIDNILAGETKEIKKDVYFFKGVNEDAPFKVTTGKFSRYEITRTFPNKDTVVKYLNGEISGFEWDLPEITLIEIPVVPAEQSEYTQPDMAWTETKTGSKIATGNEILYHKSTGEVKKFASKNTAFYEDEFPYNYIKNGYAFKVPKGTHIDKYGTLERRVILKPGMKLYKLKSGWRNYTEIPTDQYNLGLIAEKKTVYIAGRPEATRDNKERMGTLDNLLREAGYGTTGRPQIEPWKMTKEAFRQTTKPLNEREDFMKAWLKDNENIPAKVKPGINHIFVKNGELLVYGNERGSAVGVVSIYRNAIYHIAVLDKYQGKGIATQLLEESKKYGVHSIEGPVSPEFAGIAHRFAVKQAFLEGKPVPQTVLKEYPDLMGKAEKQRWRRTA